MRSSHWQYLGFMLVGVGDGLFITGLGGFIYFQQHSSVQSPYKRFTLPFLIVGICIIAIGIAALYQAGKKRRQEIEREMPPTYLPPPPPPPLLPPPPPPPPPP